MGLVSFLVATAILCASSASASTLANSISIPPTTCPSLRTGNTHCKCGDSEIFFVPLIPMCYVASKCVPCEPGADICQKFRFCETCSPNIDGCEKCPSDHFGKYCHLKKQSHASNGTAIPVWEIVYNHRQRRNILGVVFQIVFKIGELITGVVKSVKHLQPLQAAKAFLKPASEIMNLLVNTAHDSILQVLHKIPILENIVRPVLDIGKWIFDRIYGAIQRILNGKPDKPKPPQPKPDKPKPHPPKPDQPKHHQLNFDDSNESGKIEPSFIFRRSTQTKRDTENMNFYTYPVNDINSDIEQFIKMFDLVMDRVRKAAMKYKGQPEKAITRFLKPLLKIAENLMNEANKATGKFLGKVPQENELVGEFMNIIERFEIIKEALYDAIKKQNTSFLHQTFSNDVYDNHIFNGASKQSNLNAPSYKSIMKRDFLSLPADFNRADALLDGSMGANSIGVIFSMIRDFFKKVVKDALGLIKEPFKALGKILHPVAQVFLGVIQKIIDGATSLIEHIPILGKLLTPLIDAFRNVSHAVIKWVDGLFNQKSVLRYLTSEGEPAICRGEAARFKGGAASSKGEAARSRGETAKAKDEKFILTADPIFTQGMVEFLKLIQREVYNYKETLQKTGRKPIEALKIMLKKLLPDDNKLKDTFDFLEGLLHANPLIKGVFDTVVSSIEQLIVAFLNWVDKMIVIYVHHSIKERSVHFDAPSPLIKQARYLMDKILKSATLLSYDPDRASAAFFIPLKTIFERCIQVFKNQEKKFITDVEGEKQWKNLIDMAIKQVNIKSQKELNHDHVDAHRFFPEPVQNQPQIQKGYMVPDKMNPYSQLNRNEDETIPSHIFEYMTGNYNKNPYMMFPEFEHEMKRKENLANKQHYNVYNGESVFRKMAT